MLDTFPKKQVATPPLQLLPKSPGSQCRLNSTRPAPSFWHLSPAAEPSGWSRHPAALTEGGAVSGLLPIGEIAIRSRLPRGAFLRLEGGELSADSERTSE